MADGAARRRGSPPPAARAARAVSRLESSAPQTQAAGRQDDRRRDHRPGQRSAAHLVDAGHRANATAPEPALDLEQVPEPWVAGRGGDVAPPPAALPTTG